MEQLLKGFLEDIEKEKLVIHYVQVTKDGNVVAEYNRVPVKTRLNTWSVCKGVVSCAFGIAEQEGLLTKDTRILDVFPEYAPAEPSDNLKKLKISHLLTMTTGLADPLFFCDGEGRYTTKDWIAHFFAADFAYEPGTRFLYTNFGTFMVSCVIEKKAGMNLLEYLRGRFFEPLGIRNPDWTLDPMGHVHAANGLYVTIDEMSHLGELILNNGEYKGRQIVPRAYMEEAVSPILPSDFPGLAAFKKNGGGYGYYFIREADGDAYGLLGNYGQYCIAVPSKNAVITAMSFESGDRYPRIGELLIQDIIQKLL